MSYVQCLDILSSYLQLALSDSEIANGSSASYFSTRVTVTEKQIERSL